MKGMTVFIFPLSEKGRPKWKKKLPSETWLVPIVLTKSELFHEQYSGIQRGLGEENLEHTLQIDYETNYLIEPWY